MWPSGLTALRGWGSTCLLAVSLSGPVTAAAQTGSAVESPSPPRIGQTIPDLSIPTLDGSMIRPADWKGGLLVLAYVHERQALSRNLLLDLQAEYAELKQNQIAVLAVAPADSSPDHWRDVVAESGVQFPLGLDTEGRLLAAIGSRALPVTLVVDDNNNITSMIFLHRASFRRDLWRRLRQARATGAGEARQRIAAAEARQGALRAMRELIRAGKTEDAGSVVAQLRSQHSQRFGTRMQLGKALLELGRPAEAIEDFLAALKLEPTSLRAKLWLGIARARSGDDQRAEGLLRDVADFVPDAWRAYGELGLIQQRRGNVREAVQLLRKGAGGETELTWTTGSAWVGSQAPILEVVDLEGRPGQPTVSRSRPRLSVVLFWMTDHEASLACLRQLQAYYARLGERKLAVVAVNVDERWLSEDARARVGEAVQALGATFPVWLDNGLESLARYDVPAIPTTVLIDERGGVRKRIVGADLSLLDEPPLQLSALSSQPSAVGAAAAVAVAASRRATSDAARPIKPLPERYLAMARHLARRGRIAAAVDSAQRALKEAPGRADAAALLGRLLVVSGRTDEAIELLAEATREDPAIPGLSTAYADCLARVGLLTEAEQWYHRALKACSDYAPARAGLGRALLSRGAADAATRELRLAVRLNPHDERALVSLAEALESAEALDEALRAYKAAYGLRWTREDALARQH